MDKLRALKYFVLTCEKGSFTSVAKIFGTDSSTISKAISRLETDIGIQLFRRSTRQLKLSASGEQYLHMSRKILEEMEQCEIDLSKKLKSLTGNLRLNVPMSYGRLYIQPLLKKFSEKFPKIKVEIHYDDAYVDIIEQGFDLSIRSGSVQDSQLISQRLTPMDMLVCASPSYIKNTQLALNIEQFDKHHWIMFRYRQTGKLHPILFEKHKKEVCYFPPKPQYIVSDGEALAELCADGLGLTQVPHFIANKWIKSGDIIPVMPAYTSSNMGIYILYPSRKQLPNRVKAFIDFLKSWLHKNDEHIDRTWADSITVYNTNGING